jgi:type I restriction enzyme M protein
LRDTENIPLKEDIKEYMKRDVLPYAPDAWIDKKKTKIRYEIPFTRFFYKYVPPRKSDEIYNEIKELEDKELQLMKELFGDE